MKKLFGVLVAAALLAVAPMAAYADDASPEAPGAQDALNPLSAGCEPNTVLVVFDGDATKSDAARTVLSAQSVDDRSAGAAAFAARGSVAKLDVAAGSSVDDAIAELQRDGSVAYAQPNYLYELLDAPLAPPAALKVSAGVARMITPQVTGTNDPLRYKQWYLSAINSYDSWDRSKADGNVTVAVLDTGITMDHVDLVDRIVAPYDVVGDARTDYTESKPDRSPDDEAGHGTHVSGIIAATADNGYGTVGVSYNANILPLKVCYYSSYAGTYITSSDDLAAAYSYLLSTADRDANGDGRVGSYAQEYNVRVANMSLGALWQPGTPEEEAADRAVLDLVARADAEGILTVCAAGNDNSDAYSWPSDYEKCVSVIALDQYDQRASYSNYGKDKDIAAPGSDIFSTVPLSYSSQGTVIRDSSGAKHCYADMTGTSMASPVVAGVAAQVFASNPNLTPDGVKEVLYSTATDLGAAGFDYQFGYGKLNAAEAAKASTGVAATSITGLPTSARVGVKLVLSGTVLPENATNREILFSLVDAGATGATLAGEEFLAAAAGTATLEARVVHGGVNGADLVQRFEVVVSASSGVGGPGEAGASDDGVLELHVAGLAGSYSYTGKAICPAFTVKLGAVQLASGVDYEATFNDNVDVGTASVTLQLKGNYSGAATLNFEIAPVTVPSVKSLKADSAAHALAWKKLSSSKATGYQVRFASKASMKGAKVKTTKKARITLGKTAYAKVRAYKKVGSMTFYSSWSKKVRA